MSEPIVEQYADINARHQEITRAASPFSVTLLTLALMGKRRSTLCHCCSGRGWYLDTSEDIAGRSMPCTYACNPTG
jgi:predicted methyltransferase